MFHGRWRSGWEEYIGNSRYQAGQECGRALLASSASIGSPEPLLFTRETRGYTSLETSTAPTPTHEPTPSFRQLFYVTSIGNVALFATCQAGLVNNLNDGMSWGLYPLFFAAHGLDVARIGIVKAIYPVVWGVLQVPTGLLSDRLGRRELIGWGMVVQAVGIWLTVLLPAYGAWIAGAILQGLGTAMVYPTLLAAIADHASPTWRASSLGVYRFWRDLGYAVGALGSGLVADLLGLGAAIHLVAALTLVSGLLVFRLMDTAHPAVVRV
jgi:MFS family permease